MAETEVKMKERLDALENRIHQLEQDMKHMAKVGDLVEVEWHLYGDVYQLREVVVKGISHREVEE
jgi:hypothetical protein